MTDVCLCSRKVTVLARTAKGPGFESCVGHLTTVLSRYVIGLISWIHKTRYSLSVPNVPLNTNQPTNQPTLLLTDKQRKART